MLCNKGPIAPEGRQIGGPGRQSWVRCYPTALAPEGRQTNGERH